MNSSSGEKAGYTRSCSKTPPVDGLAVPPFPSLYGTVKMSDDRVHAPSLAVIRRAVCDGIAVVAQAALRHCWNRRFARSSPSAVRGRNWLTGLVGRLLADVAVGGFGRMEPWQSGHRRVTSRRFKVDQISCVTTPVAAPGSIDLRRIPRRAYRRDELSIAGCKVGWRNVEMPSCTWLTAGGAYQVVYWPLPTSGLRFHSAPLVIHEGVSPTFPALGATLATAFGHGHCAVNATLRPSGVAVWQPMHQTGRAASLEVAGGSIGLERYARTGCLTCDEVRTVAYCRRPPESPEAPCWSRCCRNLVLQ